jgi:predicted HTH transcriptional regulator
MLECIRDAMLPFARTASKPQTETNVALDFFKRNPRGTIPSLAQEMGCSQRSAERLVAQLKDKGFLKREGSARAGTWLVREGPAE